MLPLIWHAFQTQSPPEPPKPVILFGGGPIINEFQHKIKCEGTVLLPNPIQSTLTISGTVLVPTKSAFTISGKVLQKPFTIQYTTAGDLFRRVKARKPIGTEEELRLRKAALVKIALMSVLDDDSDLLMLLDYL